MSPRESFLADCAEVWDQSDVRPVFIFGEPRAKLGFFAGPMTTHMRGDWFCLHLGHADAASVAELVETLRLQDQGQSRCH